jgi:hypothetical protein
MEKGIINMNHHLILSGHYAMLIVFCGLELLVLCMALVVYLITGIDVWLLLSIGTALALALGYIRFAIQWKEFNI